ncbi:MAG: ATP-binding protein [Polyangiaceae bacterium]|nr:ATP-binding protein [Polyangiaceae bacterium]
MLERLRLKEIGPVADTTFEFHPRMNVITGDNGLGKSIALDAAWYALTRTWPAAWPGRGLIPTEDGALLEWVDSTSLPPNARQTFSYQFGEGLWKNDTQVSGGPSNTLVVYARVDGGFSVSDPLRTGEEFRRPFRVPALGRSSCFHFRPSEVWEGLKLDREPGGALVSQGLVHDWLHWAFEPDGTTFEQLSAIVSSLSPAEPLRALKKGQRVYVDDARDFPVLATAGGEVPIIHASAAVRRILGLAYVLVWTWREHSTAARLRKVQPLDQLVLLVDEVENHLHPRWQRLILPALLEAQRQLSESLAVQTIVTTHSPLVLASLEPTFEEEHDQLLHLTVNEDNRAEVVPLPWVRQGDVVNWLVSESFGLQQGRSVEAEKAIEAAEAFMRGEATALPPNLNTRGAIHAELLRLLPDHDHFWPRWIVANRDTP